MAFHKYDVAHTVSAIYGRQIKREQTVEQKCSQRKSTDSKRSKKMVKARRNLGGGQSGGKSRTRG